MQNNLKLNNMKEYKVFTVFKPQNGVVLEVWLEENLNKFASAKSRIQNSKFLIRNS
jgi:hypothetical protein